VEKLRFFFQDHTVIN